MRERLMTVNYACFPMLMSGHSRAGERQQAGHIPGLRQLLVLVSCTMAGDHVGCFEDLRMRKVIAEGVRVMASSVEMVVVALAGTRQVHRRKGLMEVLAVPIGLDRKGSIPVVIALA